MKQFTNLSLVAFLVLISSLTSLRAESLKDAYAPYFLVGAAVNPTYFDRDDSARAILVKDQFNSLTPENVMKWEVIHPRVDDYDFTEADRLVEFATRNHFFLVGHNLIWHSQTPDWVFKDEQGAPLTRDALLARMHDHISTIVGRYRGKIRAWDVVNEALDDGGKLRDSPWHRIIGDDYIEKAFTFAHEADPHLELNYNDYGLERPAKGKGAVELVKRLKAAGLRIDAVGIQGHMHLQGPSISDQETIIVALQQAGVKAMITELDVDVLPGTRASGNADVRRREAADPAFNPYAEGLPAEKQAQLTQRYVSLFSMYLKHHDAISRVTFWGVGDGDSWLNDWPITGRTSYPLLFDRALQPKPVYHALIELAQNYSQTAPDRLAK